MDSLSEAARLGAQLGGVRAVAASRLAALIAATDELRRDRRADVADDEHDPEGVPLSAEWARLEALRVQAAREVDAIDDAIARSDAGTYGICADCGRSIPIERLRARPASTRCVACAEKAGG